MVLHLHHPSEEAVTLGSDFFALMPDRLSWRRALFFANRVLGDPTIGCMKLAPPEFFVGRRGCGVTFDPQGGIRHVAYHCRKLTQGVQDWRGSLESIQRTSDYIESRNPGSSHSLACQAARGICEAVVHQLLQTPEGNWGQRCSKPSTWEEAEGIFHALPQLVCTAALARLSSAPSFRGEASEALKDACMQFCLFEYKTLLDDVLQKK